MPAHVCVVGRGVEKRLKKMYFSVIELISGWVYFIHKYTFPFAFVVFFS